MTNLKHYFAQRSLVFSLVLAVLAGGATIAIVSSDSQDNHGSGVNLINSPTPQATTSNVSQATVIPSQQITKTPVPFTPTPTPSSATGAHIIAIISPTCPVYSGRSGDCSEPYQGNLLIYTAPERVLVSTVATSKEGKVSVALKAGKYIVTTEKQVGPGRDEFVFIVGTKDYAEVRYLIDTGIR